MSRIVLPLFAALLGVLGSGCSSMAPQYSPSIENVQKLKDAGDYTATVGEFASGKDPVIDKPISLRASSLISPYGGSFASYLAEAIRQDLSLAGKLSPGADVEVSGVLLKNDMSAGGIITGYGDIEARFVVRKGGQIRYDQVKSAHHEWESSFAGAIAIPRAKQEYPRLVQKLLAALYADQTFLQALK